MDGLLAQMGEHLLDTQGVAGSSPVQSTIGCAVDVFALKNRFDKSVARCSTWGAHGFDMVRSKRVSCSGRHTYLAKAITGTHDIFAEADRTFSGVPADAEFALV